jgi:hypothetical protein
MRLSPLGGSGSLFFAAVVRVAVGWFGVGGCRWRRWRWLPLRFTVEQFHFGHVVPFFKKAGRTAPGFQNLLRS